MKKLIYLFVFFFVISCQKDTPIVKNDHELSKKDPIITWANPPDICFGTLLGVEQLSATADIPGIFVYTPSLGTKLNEGENQNLKVEFFPTDAIIYNTANRTVKINVVPNTIADIDGNLYHTVAIGRQVWLIENLKTTKYRNGDPIPNITNNAEWANTKTGAYCNYNNDISNDRYGKLYNFWAAWAYNNHNIAPEGWHIPTITELEILKKYVAGNLDNSKSVAKALASNNDWIYSGNSSSIGFDLIKNNSSGFTAFPGGERIKTGLFYGFGDEFCIWLTPLGALGKDIWCFQMLNTTGQFIAFYQSLDVISNYGFYIRCIKD